METPGLVLQLTGPMQSWGASSRFTRRDTEPFPTRSALTGMIASALGWGREADLDRLDSLAFAVRHDRSGRLLRDFHTVGGGLPRALTVATAEGKRRPGLTATVVSERYYLADAAFTVAIIAPSPLLEQVETALRQPHRPVYLGRRSCPPEGPLIIGSQDNPIASLENLPVACPATNKDTATTITVEFTADYPAVEDATIVGEINDWPESFAPGARAYRSRPLYRWSRPIATAQFAGYGASYLERLQTHLSDKEET